MAAANEQHPDTAQLSQAVRGAADWRKRLRRELQRAGTPNVSVYIDGQRGTVRLRFAEHREQFRIGAQDALELLRAVPDRAGVETIIRALSGR
ncbi:MAG: hypothetical protein ACYC0H_16065 [Solirubrobacteraceae bacterium]